MKTFLIALAIVLSSTVAASANSQDQSESTKAVVCASVLSFVADHSNYITAASSFGNISAPADNVVDSLMVYVHVADPAVRNIGVWLQNNSKKQAGGLSDSFDAYQFYFETNIIAFDNDNRSIIVELASELAKCTKWLPSG